MDIAVTLPEIIVRLTLSVVLSSVIGFDREHKNRPAGIKTHILVCVGACMIALIQKKIGFDALQIAIKRPSLAGVVRADEARLIAQVVSGIGFLGAGTILVHHRTILGLTTAASLWAVAGIGLALGMGDYSIGIAGATVVILVLLFSKRLIQIHSIKKLEIRYQNKDATKSFIRNYFDKHNIIVNNVDFKVIHDLDTTVYENIYDIEVPRSLNYANIIEDISMNQNVVQIKTISM